MEADILLSRPVQSLVCRLKRPQDPVEETDCENCTIGWAMGGGGGMPLLRCLYTVYTDI